MADKENQEIYTIIAWLEGDLPESEAAALTLKAESDPAFAEKVAEIKLSQRLIKAWLSKKIDQNRETAFDFKYSRPEGSEVNIRDNSTQNIDNPTFFNLNPKQYVSSENRNNILFEEWWSQIGIFVFNYPSLNFSQNDNTNNRVKLTILEFINQSSFNIDSNSQFQITEKWLDGKLKGLAAILFTIKLKQDSQLQEAVEHHRTARNVIDKWVLNDFINQSRHLQKQSKKDSIIKNILGVALLIIGIVAISLWYFNKYSSNIENQNIQTITPNVPSTQEHDAEEPTSSDNHDSNQNKTLKTDKTPPLVEKEPAQKPQKNIDQIDTLQQAAIAEAREQIENYWVSVEERETSRSRGNQSDDKIMVSITQLILSNDLTEAQKKLLQIQPDQGIIYSQALEWLALIAFKEKNYDLAVKYYEQFAPRKIGHTTDWRLAMFYLSNNPKNKSELDLLIQKILLNPSHKYYKNAKELQFRLSPNR